VIAWIRAFRHAVILGFADLRASYTWRTWTLGWLLRLLAQVTFFSVIGRLVGTDETVRFILIGNIVVLPCLEATIVVLSIAKERMSGTFPLLAMAPTSYIPVVLGRGLQWLATGFVSSMISLALVPLLVGVALPWPRTLYAIPLIGLVGISSYCYACFLAAIVIRWVGMEWIFVNLGYILVMAFCGVNVPGSFWPQPIRFAANFFPVTHILTGIRTVLEDGFTSAVLASIGLEVLVATGWLLMAIMSFYSFISTARRTGSLELSN
jgi:ABC-2 type transport system permease protein